MYKYILNIVCVCIYIYIYICMYFPGNLLRKDSLPSPFPSVPYA